MSRNADILIRELTRNPRIVTRFWSRVEKAATAEGCWNWRGSASATGYSNFHIGQRSIAAAKIA
jgi:hypothetical protein